MKLNHIDLQVPDVQQCAVFFERYFGFALRTSRTTPAIAVLDDGDGFVLVLQRKQDDERFPDGFHVGFLVPEEQTVLDFQRRAREDGLPVSDPQRNGRGLLVYCRTPFGFLVEVSCPKK